jgi:hypothetical protein
MLSPKNLPVLHFHWYLQCFLLILLSKKTLYFEVLLNIWTLESDDV